MTGDADMERRLAQVRRNDIAYAESHPRRVPYYQDDMVTLYHGKAEDVLPTLEPETVAVLLTDPPYFNVKDDDWDRQWDQAAHFLTWLGEVVDAAVPTLLPSASVWLFASPFLTSTVEREVITPRFRLLNSIRWVKEHGWHQKADVTAQRRYLTAWEGVLLAEMPSDAYGDQALALHKEVFAPLGRYIQTERERAGMTRSELEVALGYVSSSDPTRGTALAYRWEEGSSLPTAEAYSKMREVLNNRGGDYLRREYEDLRREYEDLRRPFSLTRLGPVTDVWNFTPVMPYAGKHPCEKPTSMLTHMILTTSRPGDLILDPFAGSGSTLRAATDCGRKSIGIESEERYCEMTARRLSQVAFDFGDPA
jgi:site-specific DNA-methyltransferase (adenine-specific)